MLALDDPWVPAHEDTGIESVLSGEKQGGFFCGGLELNVAGKVRTDRNGHRERLKIHTFSLEGRPVVARQSPRSLYRAVGNFSPADRCRQLIASRSPPNPTQVRLSPR